MALRCCVYELPMLCIWAYHIVYISLQYCVYKLTILSIKAFDVVYMSFQCCLYELAMLYIWACDHVYTSISCCWLMHELMILGLQWTKAWHLACGLHLSLLIRNQRYACIHVGSCESVCIVIVTLCACVMYVRMYLCVCLRLWKVDAHIHTWLLSLQLVHNFEGVERHAYRCICFIKYERLDLYIYRHTYRCVKWMYIDSQMKIDVSLYLLVYVHIHHRPYTHGYVWLYVRVCNNSDK